MLLKRKTITEITAGFQKMLNDLQDLVDGNEAKITWRKEAVTELTEEIMQLDDESRQAKKIADNIRGLLAAS